MPRLKLPSPAKRRAQAYTWAKRKFPLEPGTRAAHDGFKAGYSAALRAVHVIRRKEARERQRRRWKIHDLYQFQLDALKKELAELKAAK
jgi:hypothetical protein